MSSYYEKFLATGEVKCIDEEIPFEIPNGWEWCRMQNVLEFINGRAYKKDELLSRGKYRVLRVGNFFTNNEWYYSDLELPDDKYCYNGDLLYAWSASFGPQIWKGEKTIFHYHIWNVKYNTDVLFREYLYYFFLYDKTQIRSSTTGSTMVHVSMENMKPRFIPIPPYKEQQRIVTRVESLMPLINTYDKTQESLDELNHYVNIMLKKSILQEAIQGKLVSQIAEEGNAQELLEQIRQEKQKLVKEGKIKKSALNDSIIFKGDDNKYFEKKGKTEQDITDEIPFEIPDDWKWCRIGSVLNIWSARRVHERDWRSSGIPFYRAREIGKMADWGHVDNDLFIEQSLYDEFSKSGVPQIGDLMMTAVGTLGKTYVVETNNPFYYKDGSVLCIGNPFRLNPYYLKLFFESSAFANQYLSESDGTTVATLTMVRLNRYLIPVPPLKEQTRIVEKIKTVASIMS